MADMRSLLDEKMDPVEIDALMTELFTETFEQDTWLNQYQKPEKMFSIKKKGNGEMQQWAARS